jgi:valyl-tRNA synthetase
VLHDFIWDEVADWYVEAYKVLLPTGAANGTLLAQVFDKLLRLLHPFAPFATEELWQRLTTGIADRPIALMIAPWPTAADTRDVAAEEEWSDLMAVTRAARTLRADYHIEPATTVAATIAVRGNEVFWRKHASLVGALPGVRLQPIDVVDSTSVEASGLAAKSIASVAGGVELLVPAEGLFDVQTELRKTRGELADAEKQVKRLEGLLVSDFSRKAPPETVDRERERLDEQRARLETLERRQGTLTRLGGDSTG